MSRLEELKKMKGLYNGEFYKAISTEDIMEGMSFLNRWISVKFGIDVSRKDVDEILDIAKNILLVGRGGGDYFGWSDASWSMWLKCQLINRGYFGCSSAPPDTINLPVELHVGFLCILETVEELARLRNEPVNKEAGKVAASKIFNEASRIPNPIDAVANRVAPKPE